MRDARRPFLLVTAHLIFWLLSVVGLLSLNRGHSNVETPFGLWDILFLRLLALTIAQVNLLGIWAVFSSSGVCSRLLGLMALTVASLQAVRGLGVRLTRRADEVPSSRPESRAFRFSTRDWMALTTLVALLIAVARGDARRSGISIS